VNESPGEVLLIPGSGDSTGAGDDTMRPGSTREEGPMTVPPCWGATPSFGVEGDPGWVVGKIADVSATGCVVPAIPEPIDVPVGGEWLLLSKHSGIGWDGVKHRGSSGIPSDDLIAACWLVESGFDPAKGGTVGGLISPRTAFGGEIIDENLKWEQTRGGDCQSLLLR
jgi:hypothetical protein